MEYDAADIDDDREFAGFCVATSAYNLSENEAADEYFVRSSLGPPSQSCVLKDLLVRAYGESRKDSKTSLSPQILQRRLYDSRYVFMLISSST